VTTYPLPEGSDREPIGIVRRLSQAHTDAALQVDGMARQDVTEEAEASGHVYVTRDYQDPNHSGSKKHVERPAFELALRDLKAGLIKGLAVIDIDRLTRRQLVLEQLIDWYEDHPGLFWYCDDATVDLRTPEGCRAARDRVNEASAYAAAVKVKTTRRHAQAKRAGVMVGSRGYGFTTTGDVISDEAEVIRRMAEAVEAKVNLSDFLAKLKAEGVVGKTGKPFSHRTMQEVLCSPRTAGYRVDRSEADGIAKDAQGNPIIGRQAPILPLAQWQRIRDIYAGREHDTANRKWLASPVLFCATCASGMVGNWIKAQSRHRYICKNRQCDYRAYLNGPETDKYLIRIVSLKLAEAAPEVVKAEPWPKAEQLAKVEALKAAHKANPDTDDVEAWLDRDQALTEMLKALRQEQRVWLAQHPEPTGQPRHELQETWLAAVARNDVPVMRQVMSHVIKAVVAAPGDVWSADRLTVIPQAQA
jgi:DNA invertase Pin-like site-specific DNA recombinase